MFNNNIAKISEKLNKRNLLKIYIQVTYPTDSSFFFLLEKVKIFEPAHDKPNKMACAPSEDADQPGHQPGLFC